MQTLVFKAVAKQAPKKKTISDSDKAQALSLYRSLKTDVQNSLKKAGFKVSKVRDTANTYQIDGYDGNVQRSVTKALSESGFKVSSAKDRHGNTNLIIDIVFKDFMALDIQICSISSTGKIFSPPKRLTALEVKMIGELIKLGHYAIPESRMISKASVSQTISVALATEYLQAVSTKKLFRGE